MPATLDAYHRLVSDALLASNSAMSRINAALLQGNVTATGSSVLAWVAYRRALRIEIKAATVGTLPTEPPLPTGV